MTTPRFLQAITMIAFAVSLPLFAQNPPANETMGLNPAAKNPTSTSGSETSSTTTTTTTTTTRSMQHHKIHTTAPGRASSRPRVWTNATRLAALLADSQSSVTITAGVWKQMATEANALANQLVAGSGGSSTARKAAIEARTHVREMRSAAIAGDAAGAKTHAGMALPFVYQLIEWSSPKAM